MNKIFRWAIIVTIFGFLGIGLICAGAIYGALATTINIFLLILLLVGGVMLFFGSILTLMILFYLL